MTFHAARRITLALLASPMILAASPAISADLPATVRKAPPVVAPLYSWTGFYVGGHVGYGWGENDITNVNGTPPFPAGTAVSTDFDGALGGAQIGYNYQFSSMWVAGIEGDFSWSGMSGSALNPSVVPAFVGLRRTTIDSDVQWLATVTGRLGIAANNWLFYAKGGVAWGDFEINTVTINPATGVLFTTTNGAKTRTGWTAGGGVEWGFAPRWSAKLEYSYLDFGSDTFNQTVGFDLTGLTPNPLIRDVDSHVHALKGGVNFRFN